MLTSICKIAAFPTFKRSLFIWYTEKPIFFGFKKGEKMKILVRTFFLIVLITIELTGVSCNRDKVSGKGTTNSVSEQSKMLEERRKSVEKLRKTTVAKVNGVDISAYDLIKEINVIAPQHVKPGQERDAKVVEEMNKEALERLIYRELAIQEATRQGMKVPSDAVADELKRTKADLKSEDAYRENLVKSGITEEELKKQIERNILIEMITEKEIFNKVAIDPGEVKKTFARKKKSFKGPSGQMSFEEARPAIEEELMTAAVKKREDEWVEELKKAARIEVTLDQFAKEDRGTK